MLGHGKIKFETPNIIDLGDLPPSRPTRKERTKYSDHPDVEVRKRPNYTDREDYRQRFKPSRMRNIKLDYSTTSDAEETPQGDDLSLMGDDDPEYGVSSRGDHNVVSPSDSPPGSTADPDSPGRLSARIFAEIMLAESDRRQSQRSILSDDELSVSGRSAPRSSAPMRWPRRGRRREFRGLRAPPGSFDEDITDGLFKQEAVQRRRRLCCRGLMALVAVVVVLCSSVVAYRSVHHAAPYRTSTTDRFDLVKKVLSENRISKSALLEDASSPQYKAANWIAVGDAEQVDIPSNLNNNPYGFVQRYVLAVLYFAMNGPKWSNPLHFVSDLHECSWFETVSDSSGDLVAIGVSCDNELQVRNIMIPSNNLNGRIPEEISHLTMLDFLSFKQNALTGSIPTFLEQLTLLDYLDLKYNQFTGSIPDFLGNLGRLEVLGLSNNQLTGTVPGSLGSVQLKTLAIDDNLLTGDLWPVANMTSLRYLYAENNIFKGQLDNGLLADLGRLTEVDLSGNGFKADVLPRYLFTHPHLQVLDLSNNQLGGTLPEIIPENSSLKYLSLRENALSSTIPFQIQNLAALTHLDLEANALTGFLPAEQLGKMTTLSYLFLGKNPVDNSTIPDQLSSLKFLRELSMDALQLTGTIPTWIENFSSLKLLDLRSNSLTGSLPIDFSKNLRQLSFLLLSGNLLTGTIPQGLGTEPNLSVVALHQNGFVGDVGSLCNADSNVQLLTTDCGKVTCSCCEQCCDSDNCYSHLLWDTLEGSQSNWEENFQRSDYAFNPKLLSGGTEPKSRN